jgi:hypothetical protein
MKTLLGRILRLLAAVGWVGAGVGVAQAGVIPATNPPPALTLRVDDLGLPLGGEPTLSLYQLNGTLPATVTGNSPSRCTKTGAADTVFVDVTDCWLPELGQEVYVVVNGSTAVPSLVPPAPTPVTPISASLPNPFVAALTTSAYPGQCTNTGSGTDPDVVLASIGTSLATPAGTLVGYRLTPNDCGAMSVIQVVALAGTFQFIVPRDGTGAVAANGIPEIWEALYGGNLNLSADADTGPVGGAPCCDGISTFDEYRGFVVAGQQIRTHPTQKDVFIHLRKAACTTDSSGQTLLGGGVTTYPTGGESLFANVFTLLSADRVHLLASTEWDDRFVSLTPPQTLAVSDPVADRVINRNRLYGPPQRGIRMMECLDTSDPYTLGWSFGTGSPNAVGNVILYTQRIVNYINGLIAAGGTLQFSTFASGSWSTPTAATPDFIMSGVFKFYAGMEAMHTLDLTPTPMGTNRVSYGFHYAPGNGDCVDQGITNKVKSGNNTFYIPTVCGSADQAQFLLQ